MGTGEYEYDVFISHASKNKIEVANKLQEELTRLGVRCFYDSKCIAWGDNWERKIEDAMTKSRRAIFIISKAFINRKWTNKELAFFTRRQNETDEPIVFPIAYRISIDKVKDVYPFLAKIQMIQIKAGPSLNQSICEIANLFSSRLKTKG